MAAGARHRFRALEPSGIDRYNQITDGEPGNETGTIAAMWSTPVVQGLGHLRQVPTPSGLGM
jgi:hypothetical protein